MCVGWNPCNMNVYTSANKVQNQDTNFNKTLNEAAIGRFLYGYNFDGINRFTYLTSDISASARCCPDINRG